MRVAGAHDQDKVVQGLQQQLVQVASLVLPHELFQDKYDCRVSEWDALATNLFSHGFCSS